MMFSIMLAVVQSLLLIGFGVLTKSPEEPETDPQMYNFLIGITVMLLVGFGYLMTFLRLYGIGAVGLTLLITALGLELSMLVEPLFKEDSWSKKFPIDMVSLVDADFAVAAYLISFGGLIGKISPKQLIVLVIWETVCYSANKILILTRWLAISDCGGTIVIHMFGAYFGVGAALVIGVPPPSKNETSTHLSDLTSLLGSVFLWVYWPSFVAALLPIGVPRMLALTQTVLAMIGSTIATFALSPALADKRIRPVDIQNAALAGGVGIGAVANIAITPAGALLIGAASGIVSTLGFGRLQDILLKYGLHDTCGVHNLHGLPSILGGIASALVPLAVDSEEAGEPGKQIAGVVLTLLISTICGAIGGVMMLPLRAKKIVGVGEDRDTWAITEESKHNPQAAQQKYKPESVEYNPNP